MISFSSENVCSVVNRRTDACSGCLRFHINNIKVEKIIYVWVSEQNLCRRIGMKEKATNV